MNEVKQFLSVYHIELAQIVLIIALVILLPWYVSILAVAAGIIAGVIAAHVAAHILTIPKESHENRANDDENADGTR